MCKVSIMTSGSFWDGYVFNVSCPLHLVSGSVAENIQMYWCNILICAIFLQSTHANVNICLIPVNLLGCAVHRNPGGFHRRVFHLGMSLACTVKWWSIEMLHRYCPVHNWFCSSVLTDSQLVVQEKHVAHSVTVFIGWEHFIVYWVLSLLMIDSQICLHWSSFHSFPLEPWSRKIASTRR